VTNGCVGAATDIDPQPCNAIGCSTAMAAKKSKDAAAVQAAAAPGKSGAAHGKSASAPGKAKGKDRAL